jgi:hypothetical protein
MASNATVSSFISVIQGNDNTSLFPATIPGTLAIAEGAKYMLAISFNYTLIKYYMHLFLYLFQWALTAACGAVLGNIFMAGSILGAALMGCLALLQLCHMLLDLVPFALTIGLLYVISKKAWQRAAGRFGLLQFSIHHPSELYLDEDMIKSDKEQEAAQ